MTRIAPQPPTTAPRPTTDTPGLLPLWYTWLLGAVLVGATTYGLFAGDAYRVADDVIAQGRGQDLLTLLTVPLLVYFAHRAHRGSLEAHLGWLGLLLYIAYTYVSYAFGVPFNDAFLAYVVALGLSSYGLLLGLVRVHMPVAQHAFADAPRRAVSWLLLVAGGLFALLWLGDIAAALPGGVPEATMAYDLPNPIHVLDLAWLIPATIATGVLLRREAAVAPVLAAVILVKLLTLSLAIGFMIWFMAIENLTIDVVPMVLFAALGAACTWALVGGLRRLQGPAEVWMLKRVW